MCLNFLSRMDFQVFGVPEVMTPDCSTQLKSELYQFLTNFFDPARIRTMSYHPASSGMVERFHHQLLNVGQLHFL
ncbi:hypothetical protein TNCV_444141 [Trichonephila clavipes]|nr:hypothetical protein TNCV_444141 [Trichonephila clavipes]